MVLCFTEETRKQRAQGLKAGNWLGSIPRQGHVPASSLVCLGQSGLQVRGWVQESNKWPVPVALWSLSPPRPSSVWAITGVSHLASFSIPLLPSQFTPHSGKETQLTTFFSGIKPFHYPQACLSHWSALSAEEAAIFLK